MKLCLSCGNEWPKKARGMPEPPKFCDCGCGHYRDVAEPDTRIAPTSTLTFEQQRELYEAERARKSA